MSGTNRSSLHCAYEKLPNYLCKINNNKMPEYSAKWEIIANENINVFIFCKTIVSRSFKRNNFLCERCGAQLKLIAIFPRVLYLRIMSNRNETLNTQNSFIHCF